MARVKDWFTTIENSQLSGNPAVVSNHSPVQNIQICVKCTSILSDDLDCLKCRMNKFKDITLTRIDAIETQKISDEEEDNDSKTKIISSDQKIKNEKTPLEFDDKTLIEGYLDDNKIPSIKISDYKMLEVDQYVNDVIIEFYLNYWYCRKLSPQNKMRTFIFNTFFYTNLTKINTQPRYERVRKWTKKVNIFEKDFVFIPINENHHWFMAVICYPYLTGPVHFNNGTQLKVFDEDDFGDKIRPSPIPCVSNDKRDEADGSTEDLRYYPNFRFDAPSKGNYETDIKKLKKKNRTPCKQPVILIFDSLNGHTLRARIVATLREWMAEEYRTKHNGAERDFSAKSVKGSVVEVPQQDNLTDCGLFLMHYFQKFFECPIIDYSMPILHLEHWFSNDDVSKNCKKRREVQSIIINIMNEQGKLSPRVSLPELNFISKIQVGASMQLLPHSSVQQRKHQMRFQQCHFNNPVENIMELDEETENVQCQEDDLSQYRLNEDEVAYLMADNYSYEEDDSESVDEEDDSESVNEEDDSESVDEEDEDDEGDNELNCILDDQVGASMHHLPHSSVQQRKHQMRFQQCHFNNPVENSMELDEEIENGQYQEDHLGQYRLNGNEEAYLMADNYPYDEDYEEDDSESVDEEVEDDEGDNELNFILEDQVGASMQHLPHSSVQQTNDQMLFQQCHFNNPVENIMELDEETENVQCQEDDLSQYRLNEDEVAYLMADSYPYDEDY